MQRLFRICLSFLFLLSLASCVTWFLKEPAVHLESVDVAKASEKEVTVLFNVKVENPNGISVTVDKVAYDVELDGRPFAKGEVEKQMTIAAKGDTTVQIPVVVGVNALISSLVSFLSQGKTPYTLQGIAYVGSFKVPFKKNGELKLQ